MRVEAAAPVVICQHTGSRGGALGWAAGSDRVWRRHVLGSCGLSLPARPLPARGPRLSPAEPKTMPGRRPRVGAAYSRQSLAWLRTLMLAAGGAHALPKTSQSKALMHVRGTGGRLAHPEAVQRVEVLMLQAVCVVAPCLALAARQRFFCGCRCLQQGSDVLHSSRGLRDKKGTGWPAAAILHHVRRAGARLQNRLTCP